MHDAWQGGLGLAKRSDIEERLLLRLRGSLDVYITGRPALLIRFVIQYRRLIYVITTNATLMQPLHSAHYRRAARCLMNSTI